MFDRVSLRIGEDNKADSIPTDERLRRFQAGGDDPGLDRHSIFSTDDTC